jgi:DNA-binding NarL/FixJ family response regulator
MLVSAIRTSGAEVAVESARPKALLNHLDNDEVDAAVLDLHLGKGPTGLDLALAVRAKAPGVGIVMLTSYEDPRLLQSKPSDLPTGTVYLIKKDVSDLTTLMSAIQSAIDQTRNPLERRGSPRKHGSLASLTNGQIELLRMMAQGLSNAEIAKRKFITEKAVELAISRLVKAMGIERDASQNQRVHIAKVYFRALGMKLDEER